MLNFRQYIEQQSPQTRYAMGALFVFLGACGFSTKAVLIKWAYHSYPISSITLLTLRMLFSLPFYIIIAYRLSRQPNAITLSNLQWRWTALMGFLGYYISSLFDFIGLQYVTASVERLILFVYPTIVLAIMGVVYKKKITRWQAVAVGLSYIGIAIAFKDDIKAGEQKNLWLGASWIFTCAITYAIYLVGAGRLIAQMGSIRFTCYAMMMASGVVFTHFLISQDLSQLMHLPPQLYFLGLLMGLIATVIPTFLTAEGINLVGSDNASIISSVGPVVTILMAYNFLNEQVTIPQLFGTALVMGGILMISWKGKR
ncbi:MAG: DMT family transporter [Spirosomataceae bacterium]